MMYPKSKKEITELVLNEVPDSEDNVWKNLPLDQIVFRWWQTGRVGSGLRLSEQGMKAFELADIAYYDFPIDIKKLKQAGKEWNIFIHTLTKKLACPYYLGVQKANEKKNIFIRVFDHKIAMMLSLYGDLNEYMDSIK